jgi:hypothetical protein
MRNGYMVLSLRSIRELHKLANKQAKISYGTAKARHCVVLDVDILDDRPELNAPSGAVQIAAEEAIHLLAKKVKDCA